MAVCTHVSLYIFPSPVISREFDSVIANLLGHRIMGAFAIRRPSKERHGLVNIRVVMLNGLKVYMSI